MAIIEPKVPIGSLRVTVSLMLTGPLDGWTASDETPIELEPEGYTLDNKARKAASRALETCLRALAVPADAADPD